MIKDETELDPSTDELEQLKRDLDERDLSVVLRATGDGRNPGCSGK